MALVGVARAGVPVARSPVELRFDGRVRPPQLGPQHAGEEAVVAVRGVGVVERHDEEVRARHVAQRDTGGGPPQHGVAERAGQLVEHRRALEEAQPLGVEPVEQLVAQVVGEQPVVAAEPLDGPVQVGPVAQREGGDVETGRPALGPVEQHLHVLERELETGEAQHLRRLAPGHDQVARSQLDQPALGAQAADREVRLAAAREDDLRSRWDGVGEGVDDGERLGRAQVVHVVEGDDQRLVPPFDGVGQRSERQVPGLAQRDRDRGDELIRVVVGAVDRQPHHRPRIGLQPVHEKRGLAVARGRDDEGDRHVCGLAEAAQQPLAAHGAAAQARRPVAAAGAELLGRPQCRHVGHLTNRASPGATRRDKGARPRLRCGGVLPLLR